MPTYLFCCESCENLEFEEFQSMSDPFPECPKCKSVEKIKRLINSVSKGVVELSGRELKEHLKAEGQKLKRDAMKNENTLANLVGETKYNSNQIQNDKAKREGSFRRR